MRQDFKAFYFKSKIVFIDDNKLFLNSLNYKLSNKYEVDCFSDPNEALGYVLSNYEGNSISNASNLIIESINEEDDQNYYSVDFSNIKFLSNSSDRKNTIAVIVIDYSMPSMNGIEFCEKIAHLPVLKIMLTGQADFNIAINAFNRGIIDRFLLKDSINMYDDLIESIHLMQNLFFEKQSFPLINCLAANKNTLVNSFEYSNHFKDIIQKLNAREYYMLDSFGSYTIVSEQGLRYTFIVLLDEKLDEFIDIATNSHVAPDLLQKMKHKTHAPIFLKEEDYKIPVADWHYLLHPINKKNEYYYCLIPPKKD